MYVCPAPTHQASRAMSEVRWCYFVCVCLTVGSCRPQWFLDEKERWAQDVKMKEDDRGMWVNNWMKWAREYFMHIDFSFIQQLWRSLSPASAHDFSPCLSLVQFLPLSFIDLKSHSPSMTPSLSFSVRVCSVPAATVMHCPGQSDSRDADVLQRYDFIGGSVNHSLWCGVSWAGGDQLPRFEMCSTQLECLNFTGQNLSLLIHIWQRMCIFSLFGSYPAHWILYEMMTVGLKSWFPVVLLFLSILGERCGNYSTSLFIHGQFWGQYSRTVWF